MSSDNIFYLLNCSVNCSKMGVTASLVNYCRVNLVGNGADCAFTVAAKLSHAEAEFGDLRREVQDSGADLIKRPLLQVVCHHQF